MPGKTVHFDDRANEVHPLYPPTPSPTYSLSSLPSSGPRTPPLPYNFPLPTASVTINPLIGFHPAGPPVFYDLARHYSTAMSASTPGPLNERKLVQPATYPGLPALLVSHERLGWEATVRASNPSAGVTVAEVLWELYRFLRLAVTQAEFASLSRAEQDAVKRAYQERCSRARTPAEMQTELVKGVKRVDFLRGQTRFLGLSSTKRGPHVWKLNTAPALPYP